MAAPWQDAPDDADVAATATVETDPAPTSWLRESFADPEFLLFAVPVLLLAAWRATRRGRGVDGTSARVLGDLPPTWRTRSAWLPAALATLAALLLVVAVARPRVGRVQSRVTTEGIDIQLVVDTSSSMTRRDIDPRLTNLEVVKEEVGKFIKARTTDRIGLVSFARLPRSVSPPTLDHGALLARLASVECMQVNTYDDGTAIGVALGHAARLLRDSDAKSRVVVLLTDGEETIGTIHPIEAARLAQAFGVKVYVVAAGPHFSGGFYELMRAVAEETGGRLFTARDAAALEEVYAVIDDMERVEIEDWRYTEYEDRYHQFVVIALGLLLLELLLRRGPYLEFTT